MSNILYWFNYNYLSILVQLAYYFFSVFLLLDLRAYFFIILQDESLGITFIFNYSYFFL